MGTEELKHISLAVEAYERKKYPTPNKYRLLTDMDCSLSHNTTTVIDF